MTVREYLLIDCYGRINARRATKAPKSTILPSTTTRDTPQGTAGRARGRGSRHPRVYIGVLPSNSRYKSSLGGVLGGVYE